MNAENKIAQLEKFLLDNRPVFVLTGAGCSTGSGIPDYRDKHGTWKHSAPIQFRDFVGDLNTRRRYWARSMHGWPRIQQARPNASHRSLVRLQQAGLIQQLVTQNVDGLHQQAGSRSVIELHGRLRIASCMQCGAAQSRADVQAFLLARNPNFQAALEATKPDGDAQIDRRDLSNFQVPECTRCGGVLKPDVVFFGESVPRPRVEQAMQALQQSGGLFSIGSSLMLFSAYQFCRAARQWSLPCAALNLGRTRADEALQLKVEADCGEVLSALAVRLGA